MECISLTGFVEETLVQAREAHSGRAAHAIHGGHGHELRHTVLALAAGRELAEHESPGEATLQVLHGHVRLSTKADSWEGRTGDFVVIPPERHALTAIEDAVVLLTTVKPSARA
ncbi:cupin domain-containing protein [Mycobacterium sp. B14F4]|uniref:cupin domain-containing protein n=1 Tax=Mycobacterium sp. B14F4 TaxID=3153565 RepID=UPI00325E8778